MKEIYEHDVFYAALRPLVDAYIHGSFKKIRYTGLGNIPKDGAVILAPNHCDALMDPFALLAMDRHRKVFVARADIFRKPVLRKILTFLKIMPIYRVRDGFRSVLAGEETIKKSIEVLNNHVPFCILPEGRHRPMHSLLPLGKGISRVAIGADSAIADGRHVYIVPVGCEYGDYFRYRSTLLVTIDKPIDVTEYIAAHPGRNEAQLANDIRDLTAEAMQRPIVWIPDDEDYDATWELAKLSSGRIPEFRLQDRLQANRKAAERIGKLRREMPEKAQALFDKVRDYARDRKQARVSSHATYTRRPLAAALWRTLKTLVLLPFFLVLAAASLPAWAVGEWLAGKMEDRAFRNSFRCGALIVLWTMLLIAWAIVLFCTLKWYWALLALAVLIPAPQLTYDYFEQVRRMVSSWRYLSNGKLRRQKEQLTNEMIQLEIL